MSRNACKLTGILVICTVMLSGTVIGRALFDSPGGKWDQHNQSSASAPAYCLVAHRVGRIQLTINNNGTFGDGFAAGPTIDCITGQSVKSCEYPKGSNTRYLFAGAFWIGAVVGRDTLVSVGADGWETSREFAPDQAPFGDIVYRSIRFPDQENLFNGAVSEEDYICKYSDTLTEGRDPDYFGAPYTPLNIEVTEKSYAWSYPYAQDFVLFDYEIKNIGVQALHNTYMGVYVDADVYAEAVGSNGAQDDICGFVDSMYIDEQGHKVKEQVFIAWIADNDGDMDKPANEWCTAVTGTRIVRTPADTLDVSFNWWISNGNPSLDYGPRERPFVGRVKEAFRDFRTGGLGTPEGDVNKYYMLRNQEFDFDQVRTASIQPTDTLWLLPPQSTAGNWSTGLDTRYLLSFGPFDIDPGEKLPISFAYVAGADFHHDKNNIDNLPSNPDAYYSNVNFDSLGTNAAWASRVYDNPGVDTDSDGYAGEYVVFYDSSLVGGIWVTDSTKPDTIYIKGDGVPDFRGASPPPAPSFWLEPSVGSIKVHFYGLRSETTKDVFSRVADFEGYRVYVGRDDRESSFSLYASYDKQDYNRYDWDGSQFKLINIPYTLDSLRTLYAPGGDTNTTWDPLQYTRNAPLVDPSDPSKLYYFEPQDFNASNFGVSTPIEKSYPNQAYPSSLNPDSAQADELVDGRFKYFLYDININNLLPSVEWYVNVTAFDFGSPKSGLKSLETPKSSGAQAAYPLSTAQDAQAKNLKVYVYPNPYRADGSYRTQGYEGRTHSDRPDDRVRAVHFANLPAKCTIKIFTLDGDLVRQIDHDKDPSDPEASHDIWDLITRNTQLSVSGLYYWTVESASGDTQIGKLVLLM
ncbi:MAG TPA: hypothetical protein VJ983_03790 [candidate division Zixibacteria bacterium]|nr:hypothetical protein [candidate division Zixibacteria bacterium]